MSRVRLSIITWYPILSICEATFKAISSIHHRLGPCSSITASSTKATVALEQP